MDPDPYLAKEPDPDPCTIYYQRMKRQDGKKAPKPQFSDPSEKLGKIVPIIDAKLAIPLANNIHGQIEKKRKKKVEEKLLEN